MSLGPTWQSASAAPSHALWRWRRVSSWCAAELHLPAVNRGEGAGVMLIAVSCCPWLAASSSSVERVQCRSSTSATAMCRARLHQSAAADEASSIVLGTGDTLYQGAHYFMVVLSARRHMQHILERCHKAPNQYGSSVFFLGTRHSVIFAVRAGVSMGEVVLLAALSLLLTFRLTCRHLITSLVKTETITLCTNRSAGTDIHKAGCQQAPPA